MGNFIQKIDFLGKEFKFNIDGSQRFQTVLGGFFSVVVLLMFAFLCYYYGKDLISNSAKSILNTDSILDNVPLVDFHQDKFNLAFRIEDSDNNVITNRTYFEFFFTYYSYKMDINTGSKTLLEKNKQTPVPCVEKHMKRKPEVFKEERMNEFLCVNNTYVYGGGRRDPQFSYPHIVISPCTNKTEKTYNIKCAPYEEIYDKKYYIAIIYQKDLVNSTNYANPISSTYHYKKWVLTMKEESYRKLNFYYQENLVRRDEGFIFPKYITKKFMGFDYIDEETLPNEPGQKDAAHIKVYLSRNSTEFLLSYTTLMEVMVYIVVSMIVVKNILQALYFPFWESDFNHFLQEKIYKFEVELDNNFIHQEVQPDKKEKEDKIVDKEEKNQFNNFKQVNEKEKTREEDSFDKSKLKILEIRSNIDKKVINKNPILTFRNRDDVILNKDIHKILTTNKIQKENLVIEKNERFYFFYCCADTTRKTKQDLTKIKYEILKTVNEDFKKRTEIIETLRLFEELKILKQILLNETQCFMIKNRNPQVILGGKILNHKGAEQLLEEKFKKKKEDMIIYFEEKKTSKKLSEIDYLLFKYLRDDLKNEVKENVVVDYDNK